MLQILNADGFITFKILRVLRLLALVVTRITERDQRVRIREYLPPRVRGLHVETIAEAAFQRNHHGNLFIR